MIENFIPLLGSFVGSGLWEYIFIPIIALFVIVTVPCFIWGFVRR